MDLGFRLRITTADCDVDLPRRVTLPLRAIGASGDLMRNLMLLALVVFLPACGGDSTSKSAETAAAFVPTADTMPVDLGAVKTNLPPAVNDSFVAPPAAPRIRIENIPDAPDALMEAVQREEGISRFCYQEFGQKSDPKLVGAVALVVVFDAGKIWSARVGADDWSSKAGKAVNECLVDKAPQAWKLLPGAKVAPGRYVVQLRFRPT